MNNELPIQKRKGFLGYMWDAFLGTLVVGVCLIAIVVGWNHLVDTSAPPAPQLLNNPRGNPIAAPQAPDAPRVIDLVPPTSTPAVANPNVDALAAPALPAQPVIDATQAKQLDQAAELAAQEASQQYLQERQQSELAAPVKMDAQQAAQTYGRDPCHAPRADPATCGRGIVQATPLNEVTP